MLLNLYEWKEVFVVSLLLILFKPQWSLLLAGCPFLFSMIYAPDVSGLSEQWGRPPPVFRSTMARKVIHVLACRLVMHVRKGPTKKVYYFSGFWRQHFKYRWCIDFVVIHGEPFGGHSHVRSASSDHQGGHQVSGVMIRSTCGADPSRQIVYYWRQKWPPWWW